MMSINKGWPLWPSFIYLLIIVHTNPKSAYKEKTMGTFLTAFLVGGLICVVGQLLMDLTEYTPAHILSSFVVLGAILSGFGLYDPLIKFAGAGATVPITSFGNALVQGVLEEVQKDGLIGVLSGIFNVTSAGISAAIVFGFLTAVIFKPKG